MGNRTGWWSKIFDREFQAWGTSLGFSFKQGDLLGELHPDRDEDGIQRWHGWFWWDGESRSEPIDHVWEDTHWEGARAMRERASELLAAR